MARYPIPDFFNPIFLTVGLPEVDVVIACGSLNYNADNTLYPWQTISRMWEVAKQGIVFNLLDANQFESDTILCAYAQREVLTICQQLDPDAKIYTGYLADDFTVTLHKKL
jgi:hypothetical protein